MQVHSQMDHSLIFAVNRVTAKIYYHYIILPNIYCNKLQVQKQEEGEEEQSNNNSDDLYFSNFVNALKSKATKAEYTTRLSYFMDFLGVKSYADLIENRDKKWIENNIKNFLVYLRNERKISYKTASHYLEAVKKFYYVNSDYEFKWKLIKMYLGDDDYDVDEGNGIENRPYTKQEIQTMLNTSTK